MLGALKNVLLTAAMVIGATMATAGVAAVITMFVALPAASGDQSTLALYAGPAMFLMAALAGFFFSVVSLAVAVVTMPLAIGAIRRFNLPRPLFDMLGGGAAGFLCAEAAVATLESIARAKGGGWGDNDIGLLLEISAMLCGAALGYVRYAALVKKHQEPPAAQLAY